MLMTWYLWHQQWSIGKRVAEWKIILIDKGLKVIAGKSKVMVDSNARN